MRFNVDKKCCRHYNGGSLADFIRAYRRRGRAVPEHFIWHLLLTLVEAVRYLRYGALPGTDHEKRGWVRKWIIIFPTLGPAKLLTWRRQLSTTVILRLETVSSIEEVNSGLGARNIVGFSSIQHSAHILRDVYVIKGIITDSRVPQSSSIIPNLTNRNQRTDSTRMHSLK